MVSALVLRDHSFFLSFGGLDGSLAVSLSVFGSGCTKHSLPAQYCRPDFDVSHPMSESSVTHLQSIALDITLVRVGGLYAHPKVDGKTQIEHLSGPSVSFTLVCSSPYKLSSWPHIMRGKLQACRSARNGEPRRL